jgi:hypothetical protein
MEGEQKIMAWAQGGPIYRLVSDTLDYNLSLHQYLMGLASSPVKWSYVNTEIQHQVEEMVLIRATADSRIQALLFLYCYLRDGHASGWQSSSLQAQRNVEMHSIRDEEDTEIDRISDSREDGVTHDICQKCGTSLHSGGTRACPWSNLLSNKKAKQAGADFLRGWLTSPEKLEAGSKT